jgi:hypothetical protein
VVEERRKEREEGRGNYIRPGKGGRARGKRREKGGWDRLLLRDRNRRERAEKGEEENMLGGEKSV